MNFCLFRSMSLCSNNLMIGDFSVSALMISTPFSDATCCTVRWLAIFAARSFSAAA